MWELILHGNQDPLLNSKPSLITNLDSGATKYYITMAANTFSSKVTSAEIGNQTNRLNLSSLWGVTGIVKTPNLTECHVHTYVETKPSDKSVKPFSVWLSELFTRSHWKWNSENTHIDQMLHPHLSQDKGRCVTSTQIRNQLNQLNLFSLTEGSFILEIQTGIFSKLVTLWLLAILQRPPRVTWCAYVHMIVSVMATHLVWQKMSVFVHL